MMVHTSSVLGYRGTSLIRKRNPLEPYLVPMPRVKGGSLGGGRFLMDAAPLYVNISRVAKGSKSTPTRS